ncbi:MAG TPA: translation initiation factor IF-2 N-terminal domain-containing protein, partial [Blastocatellia bacterium]|nr:translation initiation factor IF-2 N-terminal domain-containing protein [Blastocatellia bacterium]
MAVQKIRIYDLAKELKLDNKRVIDDARREGIDVSVPSNTVPMEVAERIRTKYYPKKIIPATGPRLVKTVKSAQPEHEPALIDEAVEYQAAEEIEEAPAPRPAQQAPP